MHTSNVVGGYRAKLNSNIKKHSNSKTNSFSEWSELSDPSITYTPIIQNTGQCVCTHSIVETIDIYNDITKKNMYCW